MTDIQQAIEPEDIEELSEEESFKQLFEEQIRDRIQKDFQEAEDFLGDYHRFCDKMRDAYDNSKDYDTLKAKNLFPVPFMAKMIDTFVSDSLDKLFYGKSPCRMIGREDTDKADADAKQAMMEYQDIKDKIYLRCEVWLRDTALYKMSGCQVDYFEKFRKRWKYVDVPMVETGLFGEQLQDEEGNPVIKRDKGGNEIPSGEKKWIKVDEIVYQGAKTKRLDPRNVFFSSDKDEIYDEFPIMVRSFQSKDHFYRKEYYRNQADIGVKGNDDQVKRGQQHDKVTNDPGRKVSRGPTPGRPHTYIEWQGMVDKGLLYKYSAIVQDDIEEIEPLKKYIMYYEDENEVEQQEIVEIKERERCWCIAGLVDDLVVVRLDISPFEEGPNIRIGFMLSEEEGMMGGSLAQNISAVHYGQQDILGMWIQNFKQSVNTQWGINRTAMTNPGSITVNKAGNVFETNTDPNKAIKRFEPGNLSPAFIIFYNMLETMGKDASQIQSSIQAKGDEDAETLGEFAAIMTQAMVGMRKYLKSFESSFIVPVWELRNQINEAFIDNEYVYQVIGEKGDEWRHISPGQIRASVDFICESSSRETQKSVLIQQMLQLGKISPLALQAGQPVRIDKMLAELCEVGFSWTKDKIEEYFPLVQMEKEQGTEAVNKMLSENAMLTMAVSRMQMLQMMNANMMGGMAGGVPGQEAEAGQQPKTGENISQPTSESEAVQSANAKNQSNLMDIKI